MLSKLDTQLQTLNALIHSQGPDVSLTTQGKISLLRWWAEQQGVNTDLVPRLIDAPKQPSPGAIQGTVEDLLVDIIMYRALGVMLEVPTYELVFYMEDALPWTEEDIKKISYIDCKQTKGNRFCDLAELYRGGMEEFWIQLQTVINKLKQCIKTDKEDGVQRADEGLQRVQRVEQAAKDTIYLTGLMDISARSNPSYSGYNSGALGNSMHWVVALDRISRQHGSRLTQYTIPILLDAVASGAWEDDTDLGWVRRQVRQRQDQEDQEE